MWMLHMPICYSCSPLIMYVVKYTAVGTHTVANVIAGQRVFREWQKSVCKPELSVV